MRCSACNNNNNNNGDTALLFAGIYDTWDMVRWLLQEGGADVHEPDNNGRTVLLMATFQFHTETVQFLLRECGANIADVDRWGNNVWERIAQTVGDCGEDDLPAPTALADLY